MSTLQNITQDQQLVSKELNGQILAVLNNTLGGFEKAFVVSSAIQVLKEKLDSNYMKPIMLLQNSRLGFLTDKKEGGYPEEVVKNCLIDAVLIGLQPTNNEFNIIAGITYPTKEGYGSLLKKISGLKYNLTFKNPTIGSDQKQANCVVKIDWELHGEKNTQEIDFPIKANAYATSDQLIGKATRKARAWLYNFISGTDLPDADIQDAQFEVIKEPKATLSQVTENKQTKRIQTHISTAKTVEELEKCRAAIRDQDTELLTDYNIMYLALATNEAQLDALAKTIPDDDLEMIVRIDDKKRELAK